MTHEKYSVEKTTAAIFGLQIHYFVYLSPSPSAWAQNKPEYIVLSGNLPRIIRI